jgi:hypothetical protein
MNSITFESLEALDACVASLTTSERAQLYAEGGEVQTLFFPEGLGARIDEAKNAPAPTPVIKLTFLQFMDLFTDAEQLAIAQAAMADAAIKLWYDRALGATEINFADPRLAAGLQAFVTSGLLTSARRNRVMKGLPPT